MRQYIQTAIRQIQQQADFSFQRIAVVTVSLAICCEAILLLQKNPDSDPSSPQYDRVCKVSLDARFGDMNGLLPQTPGETATALTSGIAGIELATRAFSPGEIDIRRKTPVEAPVIEKKPHLLAVDANFVEMFHFKVVAGSALHCLQNPESVVLTASMATQLFGNAQVAIGQSLWIGKIPGKVTAVVTDQPKNAPVAFDILTPISNLKVVQRNEWNWTWAKVDTWVRLKEQPVEAIITALEAQFPTVVHDYAVPAFNRIGVDYEQMLANGGQWALRLQPISEPKAKAFATNTNQCGPAIHFTFGVLGFHLKNLL
jgi:putative ABC transport system permease protein